VYIGDVGGIFICLLDFLLELDRFYLLVDSISIIDGVTVASVIINSSSPPMFSTICFNGLMIGLNDFFKSVSFSILPVFNSRFCESIHSHEQFS